MKSLLIGCGNSRIKQLQWDGKEGWAGELTTLDMNPNCGADIVYDLDQIPSSAHPFECSSGKRLPFDDNTFDEIGAFNCMEHFGKQGDWRGWFVEMSEYHRILKDGGAMSILVPIGRDALADPGHTRFFEGNYFHFLNQAFYDLNETKKTCFTDYRWYWKKNFDILYMKEHGGHHLAVVLKKA